MSNTLATDCARILADLVTGPAKFAYFAALLGSEKRARAALDHLHATGQVLIRSGSTGKKSHDTAPHYRLRALSHRYGSAGRNRNGKSGNARHHDWWPRSERAKFLDGKTYVYPGGIR